MKFHNLCNIIIGEGFCARYIGRAVACFVVESCRSARPNNTKDFDFINPDQCTSHMSVAMGDNKPMGDLGLSKPPLPPAQNVDSHEPADAETDTGERIPSATKEYTAWDVYNNEARKVDTELVNDWKDSLNSLLLFVSHTVVMICTYLSIVPGSHFRRRTHRDYRRE